MHPTKVFSQETTQFVVHVDETLLCYFEDGHLLNRGCCAYHFASIICRGLTTIKAFSANKTSAIPTYFINYKLVLNKAGATSYPVPATAIFIVVI